MEAEAKQLSQESFEKWVIQKEMRETSDKCLRLMAQPSLRRGDNAYTCGATREVIEVGRALKKIDRTLVRVYIPQHDIFMHLIMLMVDKSD